MTVEAAPCDFAKDGRFLTAAAPALDLVAAELNPLAVSLLLIGPDGAVRCCAARAAGLVGDACREVGNWHRRVGARSPFTAMAVATLDRTVVSFDTIGDARRLLIEDEMLLATYRRIGAIDDTRMLIRDDGRLVAMIAVWRPLQSLPWTEEARRRLETVQPLIEMAWLGAPRPSPSPALAPLPGVVLTPRQLEVAALLAGGATNPEVARALGISHNTAKTHARAVLAKLGAGSRRDLLLALQSPAAVP
jgi:DNA-binding CsgD family transcriptional regulator